MKKSFIRKIINGFLYIVIFISLVNFFRTFNILTLLKNETGQMNKLYVSMYDLNTNEEEITMSNDTLQRLQEIEAVANVYPFYFVDMESEDVSFYLNDILIDDIAKQYLIAYYPEDQLDKNLNKVYIDAFYADSHRLIHSDDGKKFEWLGDISLTIEEGTNKIDFTITDYTIDFQYMIARTTNIIAVPYTICEDMLRSKSVYVIYTNGSNIEEEVKNIDENLIIYNYSDDATHNSLKSQYIMKLVLYLGIVIIVTVSRLWLYKKQK